MRTEREEELSLARACAEGRQGAWETLVGRVTPSLRAAAARLLTRQGFPCGTGEIEDLVQETLAELLTRDRAALKAYSGRASLETYLSVIAAHRVLKRPSDGSSLSLQHAEEQSDPRAGPGALLERRESEERIRRAIEDLPARDRLAVTLQMDGASQGEIAGILGIPSTHAGTLLSRARSRLRLRLGKIGEIP